MKKFVKNIFLLGLGAAAGATALLKKDKLRQELDKLVKRGEIKAVEAKELLRKLGADVKEHNKNLQKKVDEKVKSQIQKLGYISKKEADKLKSKLKRYEQQLKDLKKKVSPPKKQPTKKTTSSTKKKK
ncbi:hypothetical protein GOV05_04240 [Candidatus Woesearchaeota archaeon]|nr:hypothetical protein [Candidatus Woesearchaeota archaeon]